MLRAGRGNMAQEGSGALKHDHRRDASPTALQPPPKPGWRAGRCTLKSGLRKGQGWLGAQPCAAGLTWLLASGAGMSWGSQHSWLLVSFLWEVLGTWR